MNALWGLHHPHHLISNLVLIPLFWCLPWPLLWLNKKQSWHPERSKPSNQPHIPAGVQHSGHSNSPPFLQHIWRIDKMVLNPWSRFFGCLVYFHHTSIKIYCWCVQYKPISANLLDVKSFPTSKLHIHKTKRTQHQTMPIVLLAKWCFALWNCSIVCSK